MSPKSLKLLIRNARYFYGMFFLDESEQNIMICQWRATGYLPRYLPNSDTFVPLFGSIPGLNLAFLQIPSLLGAWPTSPCTTALFDIDVHQTKHR